MHYTYFIGIDVSKATLDAAFCHQSSPEQFVHQQFANTLAGCRQLLAWLKKQKVVLKQAFVCMEHTGWYTLELCCFLQDQDIAFSLYSPLHLKKSLGIVRGKNDQVDAQRLSHFAFLHRHALKASQLPSDQLLELKQLFAFRDRLVKTQTSLKQTLKELKQSVHLVNNRFIVKQSEKQLKLVAEQIKQTEKQITTIAQQEEAVQKNIKLICSIPGVGLVTAVALVLCTNNFSSFENGRKFASYCGVAPFEHRSGSSVRGRTQTSPIANKRVKALLSNCASSAIQHDEELSNYYHRKLREGKPKMVALNAVRAKLINRIFAVVNRGTEYVAIKQYDRAANQQAA